ncbi:MAG: metal-dependent hydrolase [Planctomycetota bacterium]|jgi:L-ascorbate metabolism protein UlaG (beta-lactamase superfamily)
MSIQITWFGHATWQIQAPPHWIIVDPFFDENPVCEKAAEKVECDYILLTHGHFDHVADAVSIAKRTGAEVLCNYEISNWLRKQGVASVMGMNLGGSFKTKFGSVKMTPALHSSMLPDGTDGGVAGGFVVESGNNRIYFAGDTALFSDMSLIARKPIDVAILPIGDLFTMGIEDSIEAIKLLKPEYVLPSHYGTWPPIQQDVKDWANRVKAQTSAVPIVLKSGESFTLER